VAYNVVPKILALPLTAVSSKLKIHPWLDYYTASVMGNYQLINPDQDFSLDNLKLIRSMTNKASEEGFFLVHVTISAETKKIV
jgi:hypothetical protein